MQLDDLKEAWAAQGARLDRCLAIDERILREILLRKARFALAPYAAARALEVLLGLVALALVAPTLVGHGLEARYLVPGGAVVVLAALLTAFAANLLARTLRLDYGGAVAELQEELQRIRLAEYRAQKWALLGGVVVWLPAALLLFEVLTGLEPLAHVSLGFLVANVGFGLVVLAVGQAVSRRYVERPDLGPRARRIVDALSGRGLRVAAAHLAEVRSFAREEAWKG